MRRTKIICTIGPSSQDEEMLRKIIEAGMNVARFNFSHGDHEEHGMKLERVRRISRELNLPVAVLLDTRGPEIRLRDFENGKEQLKAGQKFTLTTEEIMGTNERATITYKSLPGDVKPGDSILLDDGLVGLKVDEVVNGTEIVCTVQNDGPVSNHKGVNVPGVKLNLPFIDEKDRADIVYACEKGFDFIAASFVRSKEDVLELREILKEHNSKIQIISKIESVQGIQNLDEIIEVSDGIMVARGDMGVEIPMEEVPSVQKMIIKKTIAAGKNVITATQMLDSMMKNPRPTRAEATDVANAIYDGTTGIMLSGESANGAYPLEAVQTMAKIALRTEEALDYAAIFKGKGISDKIHSTEAISHATVQIAQELDADAIVTVTESGFTARMIAKYRPKCYVVGVSRIPARVRAMQFYWGVRPLLGPSSDNTDEMIEISLKCAREHGYVKDGDSVVITAGVPVGKPGSTNLIKVVNVGNKLVSGVGIGKRSVTGKICTAVTLTDFKEKFKPGDVLVVGVLPDEAAAYASKAAAIIAEEGGLTSSVAIIAINCSIPVVVGAENALNLLKDDMEVTVDTVSGIVYEGAINI